MTSIYYGIRIPAQRMIWSKGKKMTLSFYMKHSTATNLSISIDYANATNDFGTIAAPNTTNFTSSSKTISPTLTRYSIQLGPVNDNFVNGLQILFSVNGDVSGEWVFEAIQLEEGGLATSYEKEDFDSIYNIVARYYKQSWGFGNFVDGGEAVSNQPVSVSLANVICLGKFDQPMWEVPEITLYDENGTPGTVSQPGIANGLAASATHIGTTGFSQVLRDSALFSPGDAIRGYYIANADI